MRRVFPRSHESSDPTTIRSRIGFVVPIGERASDRLVERSSELAWEPLRWNNHCLQLFHAVRPRHISFDIDSAKLDETFTCERSWPNRTNRPFALCSSGNEVPDFVEGVLSGRFLPIASPFLAGERNNYRRRSDISHIIHSSHLYVLYMYCDIK